MYSDHASSISFESLSEHSNLFASLGGSQDADVELIVRSKLRRAARHGGDDSDPLTQRLLRMLGESIDSFKLRPRGEREAIVRKMSSKIRLACQLRNASRVKGELNTRVAGMIPTLVQP